MKKLFDYIINILSLISNKKVLYISKKNINSEDLAVKSKYGFWYVGNVFDQSDIAYGLVQNGAVEKFETELVISILKQLKQPNFYDIGANTGWYSFVAASLDDRSLIHSFEPLEEYVKCLEESIKLNRKEKQITVHQLALSDRSGEAIIKIAGSGSSLEEKFLDSDLGKRNINIETLDKIVKEKNIDYPSFIKIDVEGHEYKVLLGAINTIENFKPVLFIEIAKTLKNIDRKFINNDYENTLKLLKDIGYVSYIVDGENYRKFDIAPVIDGVHMYLFLHKEIHKNIVLK